MLPLRRLPRATLGCAALVATALTLSVAPAHASRASDVDARERAVIDRINAVRGEHGLRPLRLGLRLSSSADRHSRRMQARRTLSHQLPGEAPLAQRLRWAIGSGRAGEVVAWRQRGASSAKLVRMWMDSPGHRAVLLDPAFRTAGIGLVSGAGGVYATVDVGG